MNTIENGILFFNSPWCGPCKTVKKVLTEDVSKELNIFSFDAVKDVDVFGHYQVSSVPTFVKIDGGNEVKRHVGGMSLEDLKKF